MSSNHNFNFQAVAHNSAARIHNGSFSDKTLAALNSAQGHMINSWCQIVDDANDAIAIICIDHNEIVVVNAQDESIAAVASI